VTAVTARRVARFLAGPTLAGALLALAPAAGFAEDPETDQAAEYERCLAMSESDPEQAFDAATTWQALGGGEPARHCAALALIGLGHYAEAGTRLEALAQRLADQGESGLSQVALAQAGQAWLLAEDLERAYAVQTTALQRAPDDVELLVDRAITLAAARNYGDALLDLDRALELSPARPDILIYRASAQRFLGDLGAAMTDVERALVLEPDNPEGLLERGNLRRLQDDLAGARDDWQRAATLAEGLPTGDAAQANIATLELGQ
jgi:tetratricopeptide (TPR) repeat protein